MIKKVNSSGPLSRIGSLKQDKKVNSSGPLSGTGSLKQDKKKR